MSIRFSTLLGAGVVLMGFVASLAQAADPPADRDADSSWDKGPVTRPDAARPGPMRRVQPPRGDEDGPPGPPDLRDRPGPGPDSPQRGSRRPLGPRDSDRDRPFPPGGQRGPDDGLPMPGGPRENRPQPPGPPPGYPPRPREDFEMMRTRDPELFKAMQEDRELERQTRELAEQHRRAGADERGKVKEQLNEIVAKHFEVRQQLRTLEVKRLEQQVKQLHEKIEQRAKNRKEIIQKRLTELIGEDDAEHF
jgi:hypothetical protein